VEIIESFFAAAPTMGDQSQSPNLNDCRVLFCINALESQTLLTTITIIIIHNNVRAMQGGRQATLSFFVLFC
jgi:hypothetical protein